MINLGGRPTVYTDEIANSILSRMTGGESLRSICQDDDMPCRASVMLWVVEDRSGFSDRYAKACEARAHYWADELLDIADDAKNDFMEKNDPNNPGYIANGESVQRSRLRVDSRKWLLSKLLPRYADKLDLSSKDGSMTPKGAIDASQLSTGALLELMAAKKTDDTDSAK